MWTDVQIRDNVRRVVGALMKLKGIDADAVSIGVGISRSTFYTKLSGRRGFTSEELYRLARYFDVGVDTFFTPAGALLRRVRATAYTPFAPSDGDMTPPAWVTGARAA